MSLLHVDELSIRYGDSCVVDTLSYAIEPGESVGMVGESGSGKTQAALAVLGLLPPAADVSGAIQFAGDNLLTATEQELNAVRARQIAMVFQDPMQALNPYLTIGRQLSHILLVHNLATGAAARARVLDMLGRVGLADPERQYRAYPHQLSGGMRQRAMLAAALITEPALLIADEPTTALDVTVQAQILELLEALRDDTALLLITHDLGIVAGHCERLLVMQQGRLIEAGRTGAVFAAPQQAHTQALLAAAPRLDQGETLTPVAPQPLFAIEAAEVSYQDRDRRHLHAVQDLSLDLSPGETVAIVGESGSGKSSLVRAALALVPMQAGTVRYRGEALGKTIATRSKAVLRDLQLVFQDPVASLNPQLRVADIVAEPLLVHAPELSLAARQQQVTAMLEKVGLKASYLPRFPHQLSGGQAQRVAIARALIVNPKVLVCDEAVAALDGSVREQILRLLRAEQQATGLAVLFITHDLAVARMISHRVLVMYLGRLIELAPSAPLFTEPSHPYTGALLQAVPLPDPTAPGGVASLPGEVPSILEPPAGCSFHPRCAYRQDRCLQEEPAPRAVGAAQVACHRAEELAGSLRGD